MGRKARHRAEEREANRPHGLGPEDEKSNQGRDRCPRCGSAHLVAMQQRFLGAPPFAPGGDVVCLNCNWQGKMGPGY